MDKETEQWIKEINEKSKQRLKEHFEERKVQRWAEQELREFSKPKNEPHYSTLDWEIDDEEFDDFTIKRDKFIDDIIWEDKTEPNKLSKNKD